MAATRMIGAELSAKFSPVKNRAKAKSINLSSPDALTYAIRLIHQVCCLAGAFDLIAQFAHQDLCIAIHRRDTAA